MGVALCSRSSWMSDQGWHGRRARAQAIKAPNAPSNILCSSFCTLDTCSKCRRTYLQRSSRLSSSLSCPARCMRTTCVVCRCFGFLPGDSNNSPPELSVISFRTMDGLFVKPYMIIAFSHSIDGIPMRAKTVVPRTA
jgi:hypothetical protein